MFAECGHWLASSSENNFWTCKMSLVGEKRAGIPVPSTSELGICEREVTGIALKL